MHSTSRKTPSFVILAAAMAVSACQPKVEVAPPPLLNGQWADQSGIATATFNNGSFTSVANDTGNVVATGSYVAQSETQVTINWTGKISGQANTAKCTRTDSKLDCIDKDGKTFTLVRQSVS